jgi:hypothetical protein
MVRHFTQNIGACFYMELNDLLEFLTNGTGRQSTENVMLDDSSHRYTVRNVAVGVFAGEAVRERFHLQVVGKGFSELWIDDVSNRYSRVVQERTA